MKPELTICVLAKTHISVQTTACLANITNNTLINEYVTTTQRIAADQSDLPKIRSNELTKWYEKANPKDLFMFIDSDQTFSHIDIVTSIILSNKYDVVCGSYAKKSGGITVQPKFPVKFYKDLQGDLWYGSTGFMIINYDIVKVLAEKFKEKYVTGANTTAYPFFYERLVDEPEILGKNLWLSEDYSFCHMVRNNGGTVYGYISHSIGHICSTEKFVNVPTSKIWNNKSIAVYCHNSLEKWSPHSLSSGIGGSETSVIYLTRYWATKGYEITVFCNCEKPGIYNNVSYLNISDFNFMDEFHILIIWRNSKILSTTDIVAKKKILDLHDVIKKEDICQRLIDTVDVFCTKSFYQASLLPPMKTDKISVIPNGGAFQFKTEEKRDPNYLIYASSYDRGLMYMLAWGWPKIKKACPEAYLKIFYGWQGFDACEGDKTKQDYKEMICFLMKQDGVQECGRISQEKLAIEKSKANIHYYTGDFQEIDCISVRESASLGAIPIVSKHAKVFCEKPYCILVDGDPTRQEMQENAADIIIELLKNKDLADKKRKELYVPENETWENVAKSWLKLF